MESSASSVVASLRPSGARVLVFVGLLASTTAAQGTLFPVPVSDAGSYVRGVVLADVSGDGALDAVTVNAANPSGLFVVLDDGAGSFGVPISLPAAANLFTAVVGDLDSDGVPELVCQDNTAKTVTVFKGLGGGSFAPGVAWPAGDQCEDVVLADLDEDGDLDALTAGWSGTLGFLAGTGTGALLPPALTTVTAKAHQLAAGDLDLDGHVDAAVCTSFSNLVVTLRGNGHGALAVSGSYTTEPVQQDIALGDLDGNGLPDICTISFGGTISVLLATTPGSFAAAPDLALVPCPGAEYQSAEALDLDDIDGDGHLDVLAASGECGEVQVFAGDGAGAFAPPVIHPVAAGCNGMDVGDVNGDGALDVAVATYGASLAVLRGDGAGGLISAERIALPGEATAGIAADLDADGATDIVTTVYDDAALAVVTGTAAGGLAPPALQPLDPGSRPSSLALADLDGDGASDLVISDSPNGTVLEALGNGQGGFTSQGASPVGTSPYGVTTADFDENGAADAALALFGTDEVKLLFGNGAGGWSASATHDVGSQPNHVAAADLDTDGHADLATANYGSQTISLLFGDGLGDFVAAAPLAAGGRPENVQPFDADGDGDLDLLVALDAPAGSPGRVGLLRGDGAGGFAPVELLELGGSGFTAVRGGDLTGDGVVDIAASSSGSLAIAAGSSTGSFAPAGRFASNDGIDLLLLDVDRDGALDAVCVGYDGSLRLLLNRTPTPWQPLPGGLAGAAGVPVLTGTGELTAGSPLTIALSGGKPASFASVVVGLAALNVPFKGGVLVPSVDLLIAGIPTNAAGGLALSGPWPSGVPSGLVVYLQEWVLDASGPKGFTATNGLAATVP